MRARHDAQGTTLAAEELSVEAERLAVTEETAELATAKDELFALSNRAQLGMQRAAHHDAEASDLVSRAEAGRREVAELTARAAAQAASMDEIAGRLVEIDAAAETSEQAYEEQARAQEDRRAALAEARRSLDRAMNELASANARIARREAERASGLARREDLAGRLAGIGGEDATAAERHAVVAGEEAALHENVAVATERAEAGRVRKQSDEAKLAVVRGDLSRGELELETLREEAHRRRSRLGSLTEIQDRYERFQKGVRAIMQEHRASGGDGIKAVVADIMQPPPELELAVEAVLGERLGNVIVESHEAGVEAIQFLKQKSEGRSSFIPRALRTARSQPQGEVLFDAMSMSGTTGTSPAEGFVPVVDAAAIAAAWPKGEGVRGPILDLIGYDRQYDEVATYLLGDVLVVENLERALALWRETHTAKTIVTLDGEVIDPHGVVTGGSRESAVAGVLEQKREIRELEAVMARLDTDVEAALARQVARKQEAADLGQALEEATNTLRQDEMSLFGHRKDLDRARATSSGGFRPDGPSSRANTPTSHARARTTNGGSPRQRPGSRAIGRRSAPPSRPRPSCARARRRSPTRSTRRSPR